MKDKKLVKTLVLKKSTVSHLNNLDMKGVKGGVYTGYTCEFDECNTYWSCVNTECWICESLAGCPDPPEDGY